MSKKQIAILILASIIILSVCIYFVFFRLNKKTSETPNNQGQNQTLSIEDKKISDNTAPLKIDITYPEISGQDEFNALVKNAIDKQISDFKTNSLENDKAVKETDPVTYANYPREYDLLISYEKGQVDQNLASIVLDTYSFTGGAHGLQTHTVFNYDFKNKREITLADIFSDQENYLQKISDYCIAELTKQITKNAGNTDGAWIQDGAGPVAENFSKFLINKDSITFYFEQYQVAPYAWGNFEVVMPR